MFFDRQGTFRWYIYHSIMDKQYIIADAGISVCKYTLYTIFILASINIVYNEYFWLCGYLVLIKSWYEKERFTNLQSAKNILMHKILRIIFVNPVADTSA